MVCDFNRVFVGINLDTVGSVGLDFTAVPPQKQPQDHEDDVEHQGRWNHPPRCTIGRCHEDLCVIRFLSVL